MTLEAVPGLQRSDVCFVRKLFPFAEPQAPFTSSLAEQLAVIPPFDPAQVQDHGPVPLTAEAEPEAQSFDDGSVRKLFPFTEPQAPFTSRFAEQLTVKALLDPAQVQLHGPVPLTTEALPALQRFDFGAVKKLCPFEEPHSPCRLAEQLMVVPPFDPAQVQFHGPDPVGSEAVPALQRRFEVGAVENPSPFADPQAPLTGKGTVMALEVPVTDEFPVNVAVMVWLPPVFKVAENVPEPLVSEASAGSFADPSVLVKWTMPK